MEPLDAFLYMLGMIRDLANARHAGESADIATRADELEAKLRAEMAPAEPGEPAGPAEHAEPAEPAAPAEPGEPAEPTESTESK